MFNDKFDVNFKEEFTHGKAGVTLKFLPILLIYLWLPLNIITLIASIVLLVIGNVSYPRQWADFVALIFSLIFIMTLPFLIINQLNTIQVYEKGLRIQVFAFRYFWIFIPWKDILGIELSPIRDRWNKPVWLLIVRKLTYWHCLISLYYRIGLQPGIAITSDLINRGQLLEIVRNKLAHEK